MKNKPTKLVWDGRSVVNPAYLFNPSDYLQEKNEYSGLPQSYCDTDFSPLYADTSFGGDAFSDLRDFGNVDIADDELMNVYLTGTDNDAEYVEPDYVELSSAYDAGYSDGYMGYDSLVNEYLSDEDQQDYRDGYEAGQFEQVKEDGAEGYDLELENPYAENTWQYEAWDIGYTLAEENMDL